MDTEYGAMLAGEAMDRAASSGRLSASDRIGSEPKLRERLCEIEKLLSDSTRVICDSADRLFGSSRLGNAGEMANQAKSPAEPSIADIVNRILNLTRSNREEAMRFNQIG